MTGGRTHPVEPFEGLVIGEYITKLLIHPKPQVIVGVIAPFLPVERSEPLQDTRVHQGAVIDKVTH